MYVRRQSNSSYWPTLIKSQELLCLTPCVCVNGNIWQTLSSLCDLGYYSVDCTSKSCQASTWWTKYCPSSFGLGHMMTICTPAVWLYWSLGGNHPHLAVSLCFAQCYLSKVNVWGELFYILQSHVSSQIKSINNNNNDFVIFIETIPIGKIASGKITFKVQTVLFFLHSSTLWHERSPFLHIILMLHMKTQTFYSKGVHALPRLRTHQHNIVTRDYGHVSKWGSWQLMYCPFWLIIICRC